jgi:putative DNA primase/helicase
MTMPPDWSIFQRSPGEDTPPPPPEPPDDTPPAEPAPIHVARERTDDGNALALVDWHSHEIRYCPERGSWLTWNGHRWQWDPPTGGLLTELARRVARDLPRDNEPARGWRRKSLMQPRINAMIALARSDPRTVAHAVDLDARPFELNTPAGVVDLRTGRLLPPDPAALHTRTTTVAPDFDAPATRFLDFMADTFAGDPALTGYVQRLLGVSMIGTVLEQVLPFAHGAGANGKSTLAGVVQRLLGLGDDGYSISAPAELLTSAGRTEHPTEIARLAGARLVVTAELDEGQRFAEAKIKQLTGRDVLAGRFMGKDFFSFRPTHTIWLLANHQPDVRTGGDAFWRRIKLVPFLHVVPAERRDPHLEDTLVEQEGPAILAWLIRGAADYLNGGLREPSEVIKATAAYQLEQDTVARFVEERCTTGDPNQVHLACRSGELYAHYEKWCATEGDDPVSQKAFSQNLKARFGVIGERTRHGKVLHGIRPADLDSEDPPPPPPPPPPVEEHLPWPGYPNTPDPEKGDSRWS